MIQVFIDEAASFERNQLHFHVYDRTASHLIIYKPDGTLQAIKATPNEVPPRFPIILPREAAHPLLAALSRHLGAVEHPEQLRRDFDRLQGRHDLLVDHLLTSGENNARAFRVLTEQWGRPRP